MTITFKVTKFGGILLVGFFAFKSAAAQSTQSSPGAASDLVIESIQLDPPNGSILREQTPIRATIQFRFTKPASEIGVWVRIFDEKYKSQYFGSPDRMRPGTHRVIRGAYLTEPGTLDKLTVVFKNTNSAEIFRRDIPVNYTFVPDPALDAQKKDGAGSKILKVTFPTGKGATVRKGTFIPINLEYSINTPRGLIAGTIPETKCSMTYAGLTEPLRGNGEIRMGFAVGESCVIKRVRVLLRNEAEGYVYDELVDVDLTVLD